MDTDRIPPLAEGGEGDPDTDRIDPDAHLGDTQGDPGAQTVADLVAQPVPVQLASWPKTMATDERRPNGWSIRRVAVDTVPTLILGRDPRRRSFTIVDRNTVAGTGVAIHLAPSNGEAQIGNGITLNENDEHSGDHTAEVWAIASVAGAVAHVLVTFDNPAKDVTE